MNGIPVAKLWSGERIELYVTAGDHILGVKPDPQLMGALSEIACNISTGRTYYFRISITETSLNIQPTAALN
jgi:hypothetical protein